MKIISRIEWSVLRQLWCTLVLSVIQQPLARFSISGKHRSCTTTGIGHTSVPIRRLSTLQRPVVLITSPRPHFSATPVILEPSFLRTYGVNLPSSLTMGLSTPESVRPAHQCRFRYGYRVFEFFLDLLFSDLSSQRKNLKERKPSFKNILHQSETSLIFLGSVSSTDGQQCCGTRAHTATGIGSPSLVTHVSMLTPESSRKSILFPSKEHRTLRYQNESFSVVSVVPFSPEYGRRRRTHSVRWYAIIIERLLPSPSPECLCFLTSLRTQGTLWDLNGRSGLFPSRPWTFAPRVCPDTHPLSAFGVFLDFVKVWAPVIQQVLYLRKGVWV